jgi:hypothetical protein
LRKYVRTVRNMAGVPMPYTHREMVAHIFNHLQ